MNGIQFTDQTLNGAGPNHSVIQMSVDLGNQGRTQTFLTDSTALQEGLRLGGAGVWRWKIDSDLLEWTKNLESVHHLDAGTFDGTLTTFRRDLHPDDADDVWQKINTCIKTDAPFHAVYRAAPRSGSPDLWIDTTGGITSDADGARYLTGVCLEVSERVRNEQQLQRRLTQQSAIASFGSFALHERDLDKVLEGAVKLAGDVLNVPLTKILQFAHSADHLVLRAGIGWAEGLVGHGKVGIERESQAGFTLLSNGPVIVADLKTETRFDGPQLLHDHAVRSGMSVIIPGSDLRPFGVFGIHDRVIRDFDMTDANFLLSLANIVAGAARQADALNHQTLLLREMSHRAGNMLQLVNSIANQTFHPSADAQQARRIFSERLAALARSNYVVSRGGWNSTRFAELVGESLKPFEDRITAKSRDILLAPELCFDMGLVLHELATNSVKYGSLGNREGGVTLSWSLTTFPKGGSLFHFEWEDPRSVQTTTAGSGFGSKLVSALVEQQWNGTISTATQPHFRLCIDIPFPE